MCAGGDVAAFWVCLCLCTKNTHAIHGMQTLCLVVYMFLPVLMYFFLPSCLFAAPVCDDPCTVLNVFQRVQKAAKIKKKAVCKKKIEIEEHAFFNHLLHVCVHHLCNFHKFWFIPCEVKL